MPVVPAELGVGALERRVTVSLRLLDTTANASVVVLQYQTSVIGMVDGRNSLSAARCIACVEEVREAYPFLWFFFDWLC
jgi:hypothetical protein